MALSTAVLPRASAVRPNCKEPTMSIVYKWLVAALLLALVAGGLWGGYTHIQLNKARAEVVQARQEASGYLALAQAEKAAYEAAEALHAQETKVLTVRAKRAEQQAKENKEQSRVLAEALRANAGWADSPIPDGLRNALKRPSGR